MVVRPRRAAESRGTLALLTVETDVCARVGARCARLVYVSQPSVYTSTGVYVDW